MGLLSWEKWEMLSWGQSTRVRNGVGRQNLDGKNEQSEQKQIILLVSTS